MKTKNIAKKIYSSQLFHNIYYMMYKYDFFSQNTSCYKVSIVIPSCNNEQTIISCLYSLLNQSHKNLEIILVDDHSQDNTVKKIKEFQKNNPIIDIKINQSQKKIGVAQARNIGLNLATGDFVTFQDADDISDQNRILFQLKSLLINPKKKLSLCLYHRFYKDKIIKINHKKFHKCIISMMFPRKEILSLLGGMLSLKIGEDSEFRERIISFFGKEIEIIVKIPLYKALFSQNSTFFSECKDIKYKKDNIIYNNKKIIENKHLNYYRLWHDKIRTAKAIPHASKAPSLLHP